MTKPSYQIISFSASTNFLPVNVASVSSSSPTLIHTAHATNYDELWMSAYNYKEEDAVLTLCLGGTSNHQKMSLVIPSFRGLFPVITGLRFTGSIAISAYASVTDTISLIGSCNRIIFI